MVWRWYSACLRCDSCCASSAAWLAWAWAIGDWRWLDGRDDSPWYPSVRLFRQDETRDYARAVQRVRAELQALASRFQT